MSHSAKVRVLRHLRLFACGSRICSREVIFESAGSVPHRLYRRVAEYAFGNGCRCACLECLWMTRVRYRAYIKDGPAADSCRPSTDVYGEGNLRVVAQQCGELATKASLATSFLALCRCRGGASSWPLSVSGLRAGPKLLYPDDLIADRCTQGRRRVMTRCSASRPSIEQGWIPS